MRSLIQEVFDVQTLGDEEIRQLEYILMSPSWDRVFRPYITNMSNFAKSKLFDPRQARVDEYPDDFLRGLIAALDGLSTFFDTVVSETARNRTEQIKSVEEIYAEKVLSGAIGPAGQVNEDAI